VRAVALCDQVVRPEDLPERVRRSFKKIGKESNGDRATSVEEDEILLPLSDIERRHILRVLSRTGGNKQAAARILGIDRTTLQRKLERYELEGSNGASATDEY
jgi:DNA-binding NtrC family response regulator